jgi:hypothetical protein
MFYRLDNEGVTEVVGNTTLTGLSLGSHNLTVYATNEAGNTGVSQTTCFTIEEADPVASVVLIAGVSIAVIVAGAGLLVYFRKRKRLTDSRLLQG